MSRVRRTTVAAACAVALLGAVSAAALVLPAPAEAIGLQETAPAGRITVKDVPRVSPSTGTTRTRHLIRHRAHYVQWRFLGKRFSIVLPSIPIPVGTQGATDNPVTEETHISMAAPTQAAPVTSGTPTQAAPTPSSTPADDASTATATPTDDVPTTGVAPTQDAPVPSGAPTYETPAPSSPPVLSAPTSSDSPAAGDPSPAPTAPPLTSTPSATPTATPTPSDTVPAPPVLGSTGSDGIFIVGTTKPSAQNTGAGVIRPYPTRVINGDVTLTGNQSLKDTIVHGRVTVKGTNNVVENCVITGSENGGYTGSVWLVNTSSATNALVRFNTLRATSTSPYTNGIGLRNVTAERNDISRVIDGFDIDVRTAGDSDAHTTISGNYVHDLMFYAPDPAHSVTPTPAGYAGPWVGQAWSHDDGIQITSGNGVTVLGNTIEASWANDIGTLPLPTSVAELSSMMITAPRGPVTGLLVGSNWFDGGAYSVNAGGAAGWGTFVGNRFGRNIQGTGDTSFTLVFDSAFIATTVNNTYEDSGAPVLVRRNY